MEEVVTIENILAGSNPFQIYICDVGVTVVIYTITNTQIPFQFDLPIPFLNSNFSVKIIDNNNCEILKIFNYDNSCDVTVINPFNVFCTSTDAAPGKR